MSEAMNVQLHGAAGTETARGPSGSKPAGKTGGFQALLSSLLNNVRKGAATGKEGAKASASMGGKKNSLARARSKDGMLPLSTARAGDADTVLGKQKSGKLLDGPNSLKTPKEIDLPDTAAKKAPKRALPDEIASSSRSRETMAAALANNADVKAASKANEQAKEAQKTVQGSDGVASPVKKGRIDLVDARKAARKAAQKAEAAEMDRSSEAGRKPEGLEGPMAGKESRASAPERQLTIDLGAEGDRSAKGEAAKGETGGTGFASRLAESLRDVYNAEIVKHSAVILRGDDTGLIRLNLKPESLGNVKVRLNLADNSITGTIIVESEAAKDAFEANIEHLAKSFVDSGFQDAKLQVSVDSGGSGGADAQARREAAPDYRQAAKALDAAVPLAGTPGDYRGRPGGLSVFA